MYITTINRFTIESGSSHAHENLSRSKDASLGRVALTQMITNIIKKDFKNSQHACSKYKSTEASGVFPNKTLLKYVPNGDKYPPKNRIEMNMAFANIIAYSLK